MASIGKLRANGSGADAPICNEIDALTSAYDAVTNLLRSINGVQFNASDSGKNSCAEALVSIVFDTSDLIQYFRHNRLPTGIQRVQMEIIRFALLKGDPTTDIKICCFTESIVYWREVPPAMFIGLRTRPAARAARRSAQ